MVHGSGAQFCGDADALAKKVAAFLAEGLRNSEPALLITTPERLSLIEKHLVAQEIDPNAMKRLGDLVVLDAQDILNLVITDGAPNADVFRDAMKRILDQICRGRGGCRVRAFADVMDVLWRGEITAATAIRLETLWNELAAARGASLLSSYAVGHFYKGPLDVADGTTAPGGRSVR